MVDNSPNLVYGQRLEQYPMARKESVQPFLNQRPGHILHSRSELEQRPHSAENHQGLYVIYESTRVSASAVRNVTEEPVYIMFSFVEISDRVPHARKIDQKNE